MKKLTIEEKIYGYHIDFVGHVNNIVYIQWLENGRFSIMEKLGIPATEVADQEGIVPALTETQIRYKKPLFFHNTATINMWISKLNNASAIMEFDILNELGEICAHAQQKGLFIDKITMRPKRIPDNIRLAFERILIPE